MTTLENKHLVDLMIEANVDWPEDAEYAAQDKYNLLVHFYSGDKPTKPRDWDEWKVGNGRIISRFKLQSLCNNWHQTLVTKEQYKQALATKSTTEPVNLQAETKSTVTSSTLEELLSNYQRYQQLTAEALQALQNKGKQLGLVITVVEPK